MSESEDSELQGKEQQKKSIEDTLRSVVNEYLSSQDIPYEERQKKYLQVVNLFTTKYIEDALRRSKEEMGLSGDESQAEIEIQVDDRIREQTGLDELIFREEEGGARYASSSVLLRYLPLFRGEDYCATSNGVLRRVGYDFAMYPQKENNISMFPIMYQLAGEELDAFRQKYDEDKHFKEGVLRSETTEEAGERFRGPGVESAMGLMTQAAKIAHHKRPELFGNYQQELQQVLNSNDL